MHTYTRARTRARARARMRIRMPSCPMRDSGMELGGAGVGAAAVGDVEADGELCCVCLRRPRDALFASCGHRACCVHCARRVAASARAECPICRTPLVSNSQPVIRIYG